MIADAGQHLALGGAVTFATHVALRAQSASLIERGDLVIDWAAVAAVDSSALALILYWQRQAQAAGHRLEQHNMPAALTALATLYGVEQFVLLE